MSACTFFGHRDCPEHVRSALREAVITLIEQHNVNDFYIGNHGTFDRMARSVLREAAAAYPQIRYAVVLAYIPQKKNKTYDFDFADTMIPSGIETVPKRYAISYRNQWMLQRSDYIIAYIAHPWGNAAALVSKAQRQQKNIINLAER